LEINEGLLGVQPRQQAGETVMIAAAGKIAQELATDGNLLRTFLFQLAAGKFGDAWGLVGRQPRQQAGERVMRVKTVKIRISILVT